MPGMVIVSPAIPVPVIIAPVTTPIPVSVPAPGPPISSAPSTVILSTIVVVAAHYWVLFAAEKGAQVLLFICYHQALWQNHNLANEGAKIGGKTLLTLVS